MLRPESSFTLKLT